MPLTHTDKSFQAALQYCLRVAGMFVTQTDLSNKAQVPESNISLCLSGKRALSTQAKEQIAHACGYSLVEFLDIGETIMASEPFRRLLFSSVVRPVRNVKQDVKYNRSFLDKVINVAQDIINDIPVNSPLKYPELRREILHRLASDIDTILVESLLTGDIPISVVRPEDPKVKRIDPAAEPSVISKLKDDQNFD